MRDDTHADLLDLAVLQNEITRRASEAGLSLTFVDGLATPLFEWNTKKIMVPRFRLPATTEDVDYLRGAIIHEIGHSNRTESVRRAQAAKLNMNKPFGRILNIIEDGAMEREIANTWLGDAVSLGVQHDIHVRRQLDEIAKLDLSKPIEPDNVKTNAVYLLGEEMRKWDRWSAGSRERLLSEPPQEVLDLKRKLNTEGYGARMARVRTTDEVFDLAKELYKKLFPEDDKDPEAGDSDQTCQGDAEGKEGEGKAKAEKGKPADPGEAHTTHWEMLTSDHTEDGTPDPNAKVDYTGHRYRIPNSTTGLLMPTRITTPTFHKVPAPKAPPFIGALRMLVQSTMKNKFKFGLTSGRLDQRKLTKLAMPIVPGSDGWRKVFKKRIPGRKINTAVQIMVDGSGSMSGKKADLAADAADLLNAAFAGPLRVKTAVHGFDTAGSTNRIYPYKEFHEVVPPGRIAGLARGAGFHGNADGDALIWGLNNIIKRPEHRKIIIVLSDGMPTDGTHVVDPGSMLKYAIAAARKRGVEVFGIGIEDQSVKHFYGADCKTINSAEELPKAIIDTMKAKM